MATTASAKKRIKQNERNRERNRARKSIVKTHTRRFVDAIQKGDLTAAKEAFVVVQTTLDQVAAKGTLHKNTVARRKSRLARRLNDAVATASAG